MDQVPPDQRDAAKATGIEILRESKPVPPTLPSLTQLYADARRSGLTVAVAVHGSGEDVRRNLAKRRHDLKAALRTFGFTVKALEGGYRFDDEKAAAKLEAIRKALALLEREGELLSSVLNDE